MSAFHRVAALAMAVALCLPPAGLLAQDAPADAPAEAAPDAAPAAPVDPGFSTGEDVVEGPQPGQDYVVETKGDWEIRCTKTEDDFDPCRVYQLLHDPDGNAVAEFTVVALDAGGTAAGATIVTPLETLLTAQLTLAVDSGTAKRYPFTWCSQIGCFSRIGLTAEELARFKKGAAATVTIVPLVAPDQQVVLSASLSGFTAAYDDMAARNAETQKRADEAMKAAGDAPAGDAPAGDAPAGD